MHDLYTKDRLNIEEAAFRISITPTELQKWVEKGLIPFQKDEEGRVFFRWTEIQKTVFRKIDPGLNHKSENVINNDIKCSLTIEEKVRRKVPSKPRRYPMSATAKEVRDQRLNKVISQENITWFPTEVAALYLGISSAALRQLVHRKRLEARKPFGGKLYFKKSDLDQAIESSKKVGGKKWQ